MKQQTEVPKMKNVKNELMNALNDFKVKGKIVDVQIGKLVTVYYLQTDRGVKNSLVLGLANDLARCLAVKSVFISIKEGTSLFAIEVPNAKREVVKFDDLINSKEFKESSHNLPILLGYDSYNNIIVEDLTKMPQLLIAGTTGSGKSVLVNNIIMSILKSKSAAECQLLLIDPKLVELNIYNGITNLSLPVISKASEALIALNTLCSVMEDRYVKLADARVRNIESYNEVSSDKLPYIVTVIDEFADLMADSSKKFEACVQRLAQKGRAAGIHMVVATQRPSVDVITGVIKANLPARISCKVSSKIDSITILNTVGAENLLGSGDMLYLDKDNSLVRIQSPYLTDSEINAVVSKLDRAETVAITANAPTDKEEQLSTLYAVIELIRRSGKYEYNYINKNLKISEVEYDKLMLELEIMGVVSAPFYNGKREILI